MEDNNYLEKILGEKYNMADYFEKDTYPNSNTRMYADPPESIQITNNTQTNSTFNTESETSTNQDVTQQNINNNLQNNRSQIENDPIQNTNINSINNINDDPATETINARNNDLINFLKGTDTGEINVFNTQNQENINLNSTNQNNENNSNSSNNNQVNSNNANQTIIDNSQSNNIHSTEHTNSISNPNNTNNQSNVQQNINQSNTNAMNSNQPEVTKRNPKEEIKHLLEQDIYPDLYKILHPMIRVVLEKHKDKPITINTIEEMSKEIYSAFVTDENSGKGHNYILHDLIRILIIDALKDLYNV